MALLALVLALGGNPWNLTCPAMPIEQRVPAAIRHVARDFWPWDVRGAVLGIHAGPVWLLAFSTHTRISRDGDDTGGHGYDLHRALVAVAPSHPGAVTVTGRRLGRPVPRGRLGFEDGSPDCGVAGADVSCGAPPLRWSSTLEVAGGRRWRVVRTMLRIGRTGCFEITAAGRALRVRLPLAVPGPDWGTPGW